MQPLAFCFNVIRLRSARLALIGLVATLPAMALVIGTSTAALASPCYDTSCNYYDPQNDFSGACASDAITIDYVWDSTYGYYVDLRWGNYCGANWAKTFSSSCQPGPTCVSAYWFESYKNNTTLTLSDWFNDTGQPAHWSLMLSGASSSDRVCQYESHSSNCTVWH